MKSHRPQDASDQLQHQLQLHQQQLQQQQQQQQQQQAQQQQAQTQLPVSEQPQTQKQIELETQKDTEATRDYTEDVTITNSPQSTALPTVDDEAVQRAVEEVAAAVAHQEAEPKMQHVMAHDIGHGEPSYSVRREIYGSSGHEGKNVYFTLAFAGIALMAAVFVGVAVAKWKASRSPHAQGFVEVDQAVGQPITPEERHVANMQINGYENPTYKYFEVKE